MMQKYFAFYLHSVVGGRIFVLSNAMKRMIKLNDMAKNKIILDREALWQEAEALKQAAQAETDPAKATAYWNLALSRMEQARKGSPVEIEKIP